MIFPWQQQQFSQLWRVKCENHLPHALLLSGIAGMGKANFADCFSRALLCAQVDSFGANCHQCHACHLLEGRVHPNVLWLEPEKPGQAIKVDQVRDVQDFIHHTSFNGEHRIVIVHPADAMNINASNALLKTLEEPASGSLVILVSNQSGQLPATILSRCQRIDFPRPSREVAINWLQENSSLASSQHELALDLKQGAPLAALQFLTSDDDKVRQSLFKTLCELIENQGEPLKSAQALQKIEPLQLIDLLLSWVMDLLSLHLDANVSMNSDFLPQLKLIKNKVSTHKSVAYMNYLQTLRGQLCRGINFNKQLLSEGVLIKWMECA